MSQINQHLFLSIIFILVTSAVRSQDLTAVERELSKAGFEQVSFIPFTKAGDTIVYSLGFEHRGMNNPMDIIILANSICEQMNFTINNYTLFHKGQILYEYKFEKNNISSDFSSENFTRDFYRSFSLKKYRLNMFLTPDIKVRFGYFEQPVQSKIDIILATDLVLFRGFSLFSGISFPITNEVDTQEKSIRLAPTFFEYFAQPIPGHFIQLSSGLFFNNRYGIDYQYKYLNPKKSWSLGFRFAQTGFYFFPSNSIYFEAIDDRISLVDFEYFFPTQRISAVLEIGQYLQADRGIRVEINKQYRNIEVGFFSSWTNSGTNAGFKFMIPLVPNKILRTKSFELRTDQAFRWEYSYSNEALVAGNLKSGTSLKDRLRRYNSNLFNY